MNKNWKIGIKIIPDGAVQIEIVEIPKKFFLKAILRELLGNYFTTEESCTLVSNNSDNKIVRVTVEWDSQKTILLALIILPAKSNGFV